MAGHNSSLDHLNESAWATQKGRKTAIDRLNEAVSKILSEYAETIDKDVGAVAIALGKKGAEALRAKSRETFPVDKGRKISGEYAKGWTSYAETTRMATTVTIYNEHPALPHLLENGHVTRNGTNRTFPRTPAHVHIKPVEEELVKTFEQEVLGKI